MGRRAKVQTIGREGFRTSIAISDAYPFEFEQFIRELSGGKQLLQWMHRMWCMMCLDVAAEIGKENVLHVAITEITGVIEQSKKKLKEVHELISEYEVAIKHPPDAIDLEGASPLFAKEVLGDIWKFCRESGYHGKKNDYDFQHKKEFKKFQKELRETNKELWEISIPEYESSLIWVVGQWIRKHGEKEQDNR